MFSFLTVPVPAFDRSVDCVLEGSNSRPATSFQNQKNFTNEGCSKWIEAKGKAGSLDANFLDYFRHQSNKKISIQPTNNNQNLEFAPALFLRPVNVSKEEVVVVAEGCELNRGPPTLGYVAGDDIKCFRDLCLGPQRPGYQWKERDQGERSKSL